MNDFAQIENWCAKAVMENNAKKKLTDERWNAVDDDFLKLVSKDKS